MKNNRKDGGWGRRVASKLRNEVNFGTTSRETFFCEILGKMGTE